MKIWNIQFLDHTEIVQSDISSEFNNFNVKIQAQTPYNEREMRLKRRRWMKQYKKLFITSFFFPRAVQAAPSTSGAYWTTNKESTPKDSPTLYVETREANKSFYFTQP